MDSKPDSSNDLLAKAMREMFKEIYGPKARPSQQKKEDSKETEGRPNTGN